MAFLHEPLIEADERSGQLRPYVRPVARRSPLAIMGCAYVSGTNLIGVLGAHGSQRYCLPELLN
jgi:hypothetical protein